MREKLISNILKDKFPEIKRHVSIIRSAMERTPLHDTTEFVRWQIHNEPFLKEIHHSEELQELAASIFPEPVKPSYCFLSMYGDGGICPGHVDRPQCVYTIDLCVNQIKEWPIHIGKDENDKVGVAYIHKEGDAICYSGTGQWHYRHKIEDGNKVDMVFFHFVPLTFEGPLD